jgi:hypothetical protein
MPVTPPMASTGADIRHLIFHLNRGLAVAGVGVRWRHSGKGQQQTASRQSA